MPRSERVLTSSKTKKRPKIKRPSTLTSSIWLLRVFQCNMTHLDHFWNQILEVLCHLYWSPAKGESRVALSRLWIPEVAGSCCAWNRQFDRLRILNITMEAMAHFDPFCSMCYPLNMLNVLSKLKQITREWVSWNCADRTSKSTMIIAHDALFQTWGHSQHCLKTLLAHLEILGLSGSESMDRMP